METDEEAATLAATPSSSVGPADAVATDGAAGSAAEAVPPSTADTLSPAVRRLVRQYDLDITGIHGTGPSGRIRVGDVIGMLGSRATEAVVRFAPAARDSTPDTENTPDDDAENDAEDQADAYSVDDPPVAPTSTVFECDLGRVLTDRRERRSRGAEIALTSYFLAALADAQRIVAELTDGRAARFGVHLALADGSIRTSVIDVEDDPSPSPSELVRSLDAKLRAGVDASLVSANVLVHHYGASGSLIATPTPLGAGHAASVGIGCIRREIVVRTSDDGDETPRIASVCHVSLSFLPNRIAFHRANQFMAHVVHVLEQWPE